MGIRKHPRTGTAFDPNLINIEALATENPF